MIRIENVGGAPQVTRITAPGGSENLLERLPVRCITVTVEPRKPVAVAVAEGGMITGPQIAPPRHPDVRIGLRLARRIRAAVGSDRVRIDASVDYGLTVAVVLQRDGRPIAHAFTARVRKAPPQGGDETEFLGIAVMPDDEAAILIADWKARN